MKEQERTGAIAPVTQGSTLEQLANEPEGVNRLFTSLDLSTEAGKIAAYNATQSSDFSILESLNQEIQVANIVVHPVQVVHEDSGEIRTAARIILINEAGESFSCVSQGVLRALARIEAIYGRAPWKPPIKIIPEQKSGRGLHRYFTLKLLGR